MRTLVTTANIAIIGIVLVFSPVYAATPTPKATLSAVADAEIERDKQITKELSLNMPDQTEDPNYPVTFIDPSKQGVDITIEDKTTAKAPNPFLLPNLAIGEYKIIFKFKTKDGVVRVLTKKLLLTPKPPQFDQTLKTEVVRPNSVTIKGTALPQATIMLVLNSESTYKITATTDGKWEFIIPTPKEGTNNILAFAIKSGIVSTASKTFSVVYKLNQTDVAQTTGKIIKENPAIAFVKTTISNINKNRVEQPTVFYGVIGVALIGILIAVDFRLRRRAAKNRDNKTIAALFGTLQKDGGTIVDAIQSVSDSTSGKKKKASVEVKEVTTSKTNDVEVKHTETTKTSGNNESATVSTEKTDKVTITVKPDTKSEEKPPVNKQKSIKALPKKKTELKKLPPTPATKSEPLIATPDIDPENEETEEPEKKVLTKEEFLKQFQKGTEQGE